jgi:hypothetical protein
MDLRAIHQNPASPGSAKDLVSMSHVDEVYAVEPWLSIRWDRERTCVHAEWTGFANSVQFRAGTMKILDAIKAKGAGSLVSDNRKLEGVTNQDQLWIRDTWVPLAVVDGLKRIAVVVPRHGLGKIASEEIIGRFGKSTFVTNTFESADAALKWVAASGAD